MSIHGNEENIFVDTKRDEQGRIGFYSDINSPKDNVVRLTATDASPFRRRLFESFPIFSKLISMLTGSSVLVARTGPGYESKKIYIVKHKDFVAAKIMRKGPSESFVKVLIDRIKGKSPAPALAPAALADATAASAQDVVSVHYDKNWSRGGVFDPQQKQQFYMRLGAIAGGISCNAKQLGEAMNAHKDLAASGHIDGVDPEKADINYTRLCHQLLYVMKKDDDASGDDFTIRKAEFLKAKKLLLEGLKNADLQVKGVVRKFFELQDVREALGSNAETGCAQIFEACKCQA